MKSRDGLSIRWRKKGKRGVSPIIATILLVAITVVLAAVLYVLISGLTRGPGNTPIGTAFGAGTPTLTQGMAGGSVATTGCGIAAHYCYEIPVASASSGLTIGSMTFQIVGSNGAVWTGNAAGGGAAFVSIGGTVLAYATVGAGVAFTVPSWTAGTGGSSATQVSNTMTIWIDMGTGNPSGQGYVLNIFGTGSYSGQVTVNLP
ncbi:MAG TPA: archaellin/type IV pilin N-terminal domain-containing protein [Thermoplasmata archaeon]|nr:archaellin/type IV pilin N-terminal domain-containing protein [Thermoplasmata archaeon]